MFRRKKWVALVVLFVLFSTVIVSPFGYSGEQYSRSEGVDPLLGYLIERDRQLKRKGKEGVDLSAFSGSLEVYRGESTSGRSVGVEGSKRGEVPRKTVGLDYRREDKLGILVKFREPTSFVNKPGLTLISRTGTIATGLGDLEAISALAENPEVKYVAPSKPVRPLLDESLPLVGADTLHSTQPVNRGDGLLIGVVDTGIDYDHLDFRVDREESVAGEETSRITFIWDQTDGFSSSPAGYAYGSEYDNNDIEEDIRDAEGPSSGNVREKDVVGHGTHVTGIAAGDGSSSSTGYVGMAPAASIVAVKTNFSTSSIIDGVSYIAERADDLGKAGVVTSLSLGTQFGPHDGTSLFESALNDLATKDHLIAVSAGNSGNKKIHHGHDVARGEELTFEVSLPGYSPRGDAADYFTLDGFYDPLGNLSVQVRGPNGDVTDPISSGEAASFDLAGGSVLISNGSSDLNGDNEIYVRVGDLDGNSPPDPGDWDIWVTGISGARLDIWVADNLLGGENRNLEFSNGDTKMTIAEPGNAEDLVTVGSFNSRNSWGNYSIGGFPIGELSSFSSTGPTRDGRIKPDLVAPGAWVVSTLAESASVQDYLKVPDGKHWALAGTSMSAPHVAGAAALIWRASSELTASEVSELLIKTTNDSGYLTPGDSWGWGKLDAKAGVYGSGMPVGDIEEELWVRATPNPAGDHVDFFFSHPDNPDELKIQVYNVLGKLVKTIEGEQLTGKLKYRWDLKDDRGVSLANGLYIYLIRTGSSRSDLSRLVIRR
ncbi:S8 family serine peptidase [Candidatus Bipolaricaulota bacterium]|nr:S8 family serine peptidase [Candidatus Bipolaricaulota bacterium]